jgi:Methyltransferase domain
LSQSVRDHYAAHLGPIYSWMLGGMQSALNKGSAEIDSLLLHPNSGAVAVDLGAGIGMHAIPLARLGYSVIAIDTDANLLSELSSAATTLAIRAVLADLSAFRAHLSCPADVVLCMGDTLTHLPNPQAVETLFRDVSACLSPAGSFVCTFRDYSQPLSAEDRFIPVRSTPDRILTCFLEYEDRSVAVHDILHERSGDQWQLRVSSYTKLRLSPSWVLATLAGCGLDAELSAAPGGMLRLTAQHRR